VVPSAPPAVPPAGSRLNPPCGCSRWVCSSTYQLQLNREEQLWCLVCPWLSLEAGQNLRDAGQQAPPLTLHTASSSPVRSSCGAFCDP